ncbi:MAG TPA: putative toxin-antitoxin system toxin component, PIN family [Candidatus Bathyarchaeia archaeon]|nr:putative toxin-antitoxin system toxin component, PIN family [Candidatus Bathyarchaeia archaeon]
MKVVLDTNVLISALIKSGNPRELFFRLTEKKALIISKNILEEFLEIAEDPRITKYVSEQETNAFLDSLGVAAKVVIVRSKFKAVKEDPDDDIIVRTAFDGKVDYIVSGDKHLLSLGEFRGIRIINVDEMLNLMRKTMS